MLPASNSLCASVLDVKTSSRQATMLNLSMTAVAAIFSYQVTVQPAV